MSLCYVSCSTLCLNNLFILNPFLCLYYSIQKKMEPPGGKLNPYKFYFSAEDFKLLVMPFILLSTKITCNHNLSEKKQEKKKNKQCCRQQPYEFSCLLYLPTSYFCPQCFTRFDGFKSHFPNTKRSRQTITGKRNPRPKPSQLRMALHMPNSTHGVSHCLMEHCHIINLHEFTLQMNQSLGSIWCPLDQGHQSSSHSFHRIFHVITSTHRSTVALASTTILLNSSLHNLHCVSVRKELLLSEITMKRIITLTSTAEMFFSSCSSLL